MDEVIKIPRTISGKPSAIALASAEIAAGRMVPSALAQASYKIAIGELKPMLPATKMLEGLKLDPSMGNALAIAATSGIAAEMKAFVPKYMASSGMAKIQESIRAMTAVPGLDEMLARQRVSLLSPSMQAMTKVISEQTASALKAAALPAGLTSMLGAIEKQSYLGLTPRVMQDLERFATAVPVYEIQPSTTIVRTERRSPLLVRPVAPPSHRVDDVDELLVWVGDGLLFRRRGIHDALAYSSDGVGQAADSATELLGHLFNGLVPEAEVWLHMITTKQLDPNKGKPPHPPWAYRIQLVALRYGLDEQLLLQMWGNPGLSKRIEAVKHHSHRHSRGELMVLLGAVEDLLAYLAAEIPLT